MKYTNKALRIILGTPFVLIIWCIGAPINVICFMGFVFYDWLRGSQINNWDTFLELQPLTPYAFIKGIICES